MASTVRNTFRFLLTHPDIGVGVEFFPAVNKLELVWKPENNQKYYRKELNTDLVFEQDEFQLIYNIDRGPNKCEPIYLDILRLCGDVWFPYWKGIMSLIPGEFDVSQCRVQIKPRINDTYLCMLNTWDREVDVYDGPNVGLRPTVLDLSSSGGLLIQYNTFYEVFYCEPPFNCAPLYTNWPNGPLQAPINSWGISEQKIIKSVIANQGVPYWTRITHYAREVAIYTFDPGSPWIYLGNSYPTGTYARPLTEILVDDEGKEVRYNNGLRLNDVIKWLAGSYDPQEQWGLGFCGYNVISNFFGINPDNSQPNNTAYDKAMEFCQQISIHHIFDIKRGKTDQPSFIWEMSFKKLLDDLRVLFNVYWLIDSNDNLRIEHASYFRRNKMLDLTKEEHIKNIAGRYKYTYNSFEIPQREVFSFSVDSFQQDFRGVPIEYKYPCSDDQDFKEVEVQTQMLLTAFEEVYKFKEDYPDKKAYVLFSTENYSKIKTDVGKLSGKVLLNGAFSWANLHEYFHKYERPGRRGVMNGVETNFFTVKKVRQQDDIEIVLCCEDLLAFQPDILVKTQMGWGEIREAVISEPSRIVKLKLSHAP